MKSFSRPIFDLTLGEDEAFKSPVEKIYSYFDRAICGTVSKKIFLLAAEPGSGKSTGVQKYIKDAMSGSRPVPDNGIIVFLSRLDEIHSYIEGCGLTTDQYAVITSDTPLDAAIKYRGRLDPNDAPVLFTTSQKLRPCVGPEFEKTEMYFYKGKPRLLRIWDEEYSPVDAININIDALSGLKLELRASFGSLIDAIDAIELEATLGRLEEVDIPASILPAAKTALGMITALTDAQKTTLKNFIILAGQTVRLVKGKHGVCSLVGERNCLPADLAPLFVLDASIRVSDTYSIMEDSGIAIERLPSRPIRYCNVRFRHMKIGASKSTLRKPTAQTKVIFESAAIINASEEDEWLVIYNKDHLFDFKKALRRACPKKSLSFVYWGDHRASNKYRHIKRIMCVGLMRYPDAGYDEVHVRCAGEMSRRAFDIPRLRLSECRSMMLQGFARSNMRNHVGKECGDCLVYIIDAERTLKEELEKTFPGGDYRIWKEQGITLAGKKREIFEHVTSFDSASLAAGVKRTIAYRALGIERCNFSRLLKDTKLQAALADKGISITRNNFQLI